MLLTTPYWILLQVIICLNFRKSIFVWKILSRIFVVFHVNSPPQSLSLGKVALSIIRILKPFDASRYAAVDPAGPAPMTIASNLYLGFTVSKLDDYPKSWSNRGSFCICSLPAFAIWVLFKHRKPGLPCTDSLLFLVLIDSHMITGDFKIILYGLRQIFGSFFFEPIFNFGRCSGNQVIGTNLLFFDNDFIR